MVALSYLTCWRVRTSFYSVDVIIFVLALQSSHEMTFSTVNKEVSIKAVKYIPESGYFAGSDVSTQHEPIFKPFTRNLCCTDLITISFYETYSVSLRKFQYRLETMPFNLKRLIKSSRQLHENGAAPIKLIKSELYTNLPSYSFIAPRAGWF